MKNMRSSYQLIFSKPLNEAETKHRDGGFKFKPSGGDLAWRLNPASAQ